MDWFLVSHVSEPGRDPAPPCQHGHGVGLLPKQLGLSQDQGFTQWEPHDFEGSRNSIDPKEHQGYGGISEFSKMANREPVLIFPMDIGKRRLGIV